MGSGTEGAEGDGAKPKVTSRLTALTNIADKLTDVLNLGRVLSIGVPGCVAAFGLMLLVARFTTRAEIPAETLPGAGGQASEQLLGVRSETFMPGLVLDSVLRMPDSLLVRTESTLNRGLQVLLLRDSIRKASQPTLDYDQLYLRNAPWSEQLRMASLRIKKDIETARSEGNWFEWLVLVILLGCAIAVWGYWFLRDRARLRDAWWCLIEKVLPVFQPCHGKGRDRQLSDIEDRVRSRPFSWGDLDRRIRELEDYSDGHQNPLREVLKKALYDARGQVLRLRYGVGGSKYSWKDLHTPLMTAKQTGLGEGMSLLDYLIKEYWRFVEFSVNLPIAVLVCSFCLGLYCFSLRPFIYLGVAGLGACAAAFLLLCLVLPYWTDRVSLSALDKYHVAVNGTVAGLMLVERKDNKECLLDGFEETTPIEKMYLDEFKKSLGWKDGKDDAARVIC